MDIFVSEPLKKKLKRIKIATWNVRGLSENRRRRYDEQISTLVNVLQHENINIAAVSETKKKGNGSADISGYKMYYTGVPEGHARGGIAIVLDPIWSKFVIGSPIYKSDRIMSLTLSTKLIGWKKNILVIAIYAPITSACQRENDAFYADLIAVIQSYYASQSHLYYLVLMGDFNAWIGRQIRPNVTGPYGNPKEINRNGRKLIELATMFGLKITNTYFYDTIDYTYIPSKTLLDYIIVDRDCFDLVVLTEILRNEDMVENISTDHHMVYAIIENEDSSSESSSDDEISNEMQKLSVVENVTNTLKGTNTKDSSSESSSDEEISNEMQKLSVVENVTYTSSVGRRVLGAIVRRDPILNGINRISDGALTNPNSGGLMIAATCAAVTAAIALNVFTPYKYK